MGKNIEGTHLANMMKWGASAAFKEQTKEIGKRWGYKWVEGRSYG